MRRFFNNVDFKLFLQIVLPTFLGSCFLVILTHIVYSGGERESMAAFSEGFLIENSLRSAEPAAIDRGAVATISLTDQDLANLKRAPLGDLRDADIAVYTSLINQIATNYSPKLVVVNWLGSAHYVSEEGLKPLAEALRASKMERRILVAFPLESFPHLPKAFVEEFAIKQSVDCIYDVNRFCTYFTDRPNWMIQSLTEVFWPKVPRYHVSYNLPHFLPNFLLNLPKPETIPDYSFSQILQGKIPAEELAGRSLFIGSQVTQAPEFADNKRVLQRTYTAASEPRRNLQRDGLPFHKFWAGIAQMFIDKQTVAVPPKWATFAMFICTASLCLFILLKVGAAAAFGGFLGFSLLYPFINNFLIKVGHVYLPMFPVIYGGFLVLTSAAFVQISINNFRTWQLDALRRAYDANTDLKSNFVSLISHNLNTPVAKLRGLVDIMQTSLTDNTGRAVIVDVSRWVAKLQLVVRAVLLATRLKQGGKEEAVAPLTVSQLKDKFLDEYEKVMRNLGCNIEFRASTNTNPFSANAVFNISARPLTLTMAAISVLAQVESLLVAEEERKLQPLIINLDVDALQQGIGLKYLVLRAQIVDHQINELLLDGLNQFYVEQFNFIGQVLLEYIHVCTTLYNGHFHVLQFGDRLELEARIAVE